MLKLVDKEIAIFHEPDFIEDFIYKNPNTDLILHGHTHRYRQQKIGSTIVINPGESAGMMKGKNAIGIINLEKMEFKRIFF